MPRKTDKQAAKRKSNPLPEMPPKKAEKPTVGVRKVGKGMGVLEIPVHVSDGPQRLPAREEDYIHRSRPEPAPLSRGQTQAIFAFKRGESLPEIAKSSGLPMRTLINTLIPVGLSEENHKKEIEQLAHWFANRNNP